MFEHYFIRKFINSKMILMKIFMYMKHNRLHIEKFFQFLNNYILSVNIYNKINIIF